MANLSSGFFVTSPQGQLLSRQALNESICWRAGAMSEGIQHGLFWSSFDLGEDGGRSTHGAQWV